MHHTLDLIYRALVHHLLIEEVEPDSAATSVRLDKGKVGQHRRVFPARHRHDDVLEMVEHERNASSCGVKN
jgi:hypothetical protein